ncbi:hypothetical protein Fmac_017906 [Flemingia macrophylla]|uniref:Disease resistance R13L4/SHOC-2-like LRR domain-containing protein n=1 Tax=Flemingia macrophylla TaxID=520843 RepID=A0ABD1M3H4_9FABA
MSIRTNPMKAVDVLLKRLRRTRSIFQERGRNEPFDGKSEKLSQELEKINDLFLRVKRNEDELLDTLTEVYGRLGKLDRKRILQLGRWQDSTSHHIEVENEEFLKELRFLKGLKYLSLRGISRIFKLPSSIVQLKNLEILDLKACHNLETLPSDISSMKSLTNLILSQCNLLDAMPKGIEKLTQLKVLKGFVINSFTKTHCRILDLSRLNQLRRLSIHIKAEAAIKDIDFENLKQFSALEHLKISWGVSDTSYSDIPITLPSKLKKLHLECFFGQKIPKLKVVELFSALHELKITGGKLQSMNHHNRNKMRKNVEILHLKYLKDLKVDLRDLQKIFPRLKYVEMKGISNHTYTEWSIDQTGR